jgi:hypothetical protein
MLGVQEASAGLDRLRQTHESMQMAIDRSLAHLREMHAFLQTLEADPAKPAIDDGAPLGCGVPKPDQGMKK